MRTFTAESDGDLYFKLKWLMFLRVLFSTLLLGSTIILQLDRAKSPLSRPILILYGLISGIFFISFIYSVMMPHVRRIGLFAYIQICIDTVVVSLIIILTGIFSSMFSFLYIVIIIYSSMLIYRKGCMVVASLSSIQYGILIDLEYYGILHPFGMKSNLVNPDFPWSYVLFKIIIMMISCFAVAFLSGFLAEQNRRSKKEIRSMGLHLKRVEKMAAVGEMASGLAHEIKNPLASLRGSVQMMKEDLPSDSYHHRLMNIILRETDRLNILVTDFLMFARPPAARIETIPLSKILEESLELFENNEQYKKIRVVRKITPNVSLKMDSDHFRQIFLNLLLNAAQAIEGEGNIHISMYPLKNEYVIIRVTDNGCGIPDDLIQSIFDPFITSKSYGTGLGLSIVHRIIEAYQCRIDVESEVGRGTTFTLKLKQ